MPDATFQHSAITTTRAAQVWRTLDRPETWEAIPGVDRVLDPIIDDENRLRGFAFETGVGGRVYRGQARPAAREEERLMAWEISSSEIRGQVIVAVEPQSDGTRVDFRLEVEGAGFLGSLFFPAIASAIGGEFEQTVEDFVGSL